MATIKSWENEIKSLSTEDLHEINNALNILLRWDFFREAYKEYKIDVVQTIAEYIYKEKKEAN